MAKNKNEDHEAFSGLIEKLKSMLDEANEAYRREDYKGTALFLDVVAGACGEAASACAARALSELAVKKAEAEEAAERARRN